MLTTEPPPIFTWTHPIHGDLTSNDDFSVLYEEYQGGSTTTLVVHHAKVMMLAIFIIKPITKT